MSGERFKSGESSNPVVNPETIEEEAERLLEQLLGLKENKFLEEVESNRRQLEGFPSAVEALAFALGRIQTRLERTSRLSLPSAEKYGVEIVDIDPVAIRENLEEILTHALEIGRGGDAIVVIDKSEVRELPPEICYKFAITESTPRGRNTIFNEIKLQESFYRTMAENSSSKIGIPAPFYSQEIGSYKVIAMEKLNARSIEHLSSGIGTLPLWFDVEVFCKELKEALDHLHRKGLYHRDMHLGNIMISQKKELVDGDKIAYIIDFGLSVEDEAGLEPYKKEVAGTTFTYSDDYGIMNKAKIVLSQLKRKVSTI